MSGAEVGDWDILVREGEWPMARPFPLVLGLAGAGTVAALGGEVARFAKVNSVYAYSYPLYHDGAWAENLLVPASYVAHPPMPLDLNTDGRGTDCRADRARDLDGHPRSPEKRRRTDHGRRGRGWPSRRPDSGQSCSWQDRARDRLTVLPLRLSRQLPPGRNPPVAFTLRYKVSGTPRFLPADPMERGGFH